MQELIQAEMVNVRLNTELSRLELAEALLAKEEGHQAKAETLLGEARDGASSTLLLPLSFSYSLIPNNDTQPKRSKTHSCVHTRSNLH